MNSFVILTSCVLEKLSYKQTSTLNNDSKLKAATALRRLLAASAGILVLHREADEASAKKRYKDVIAGKSLSTEFYADAPQFLPLGERDNDSAMQYLLKNNKSLRKKIHDSSGDPIQILSLEKQYTKKYFKIKMPNPNPAKVRAVQPMYWGSNGAWNKAEKTTTQIVRGHTTQTQKQKLKEAESSS